MAICTKIKNRFLSIIILLLVFPLLHAQENDTYWQMDYALGSILKHQTGIAHLITAHPESISVSWYKNASVNSTWKQRYNYPDSGIALYYQNFNNTTLGEVFAIQYQTIYYLLNRNAKNQLNFKFGVGLGYNTNPLDLNNNNQNVVMSSKIQFSESMKIEYKHPYLYKNFGVYTGLFLSHFSNASYKSPNSGINSLFINAGIEYRLSKSPIVYPEILEEEKQAKNPFQYNLSLFIGFHELKSGLGTKPVYVVAGHVSKRIGYKSGFQLGVDFFNSQAVKDLMNLRFHAQIEDSNPQIYDHKQIGIFGGHELFFDKLSFETLLGYYIYQPFDLNPSVYQKLGLNYYFKKRLALNANLKVHNFKAEYAALGFHYQIH